MKFKYCVTLSLRDFKDKSFCYSLYYESTDLRDFNDWIYHHICNSDPHSISEIVGLYFEVIKNEGN